MSEAHKGKNHSKETKEKLREIAIEQFKDPEMRKRLSLKRNKLSEEHKKKISEGVKKFYNK